MLHGSSSASPRSVLATDDRTGSAALTRQLGRRASCSTVLALTFERLVLLRIRVIAVLDTLHVLPNKTRSDRQVTRARRGAPVADHFIQRPSGGKGSASGG